MSFVVDVISCWAMGVLFLLQFFYPTRIPRCLSPTTWGAVLNRSEPVRLFSLSLAICKLETVRTDVCEEVLLTTSLCLDSGGPWVELDSGPFFFS